MNTGNKTHSRKSSYEILSTTTGAYPSAAHHYSATQSHSRNQSLDLKQMKTDLGILLNHNPLATYASNGQLYQSNAANNGQNKELSNAQVNIIAGHHNWIAIAYPHFAACYKMKDGIGWQLVGYT